MENKLQKLGYVFLIFIFVIPMLLTIFNFFGVEPRSYIPYLAWIIALLLFFAILPKYSGYAFM